MKILAIRGQNLASLEGDFEIDFTREPLKSTGIFAITGTTGSGKSTLLDTLCLALFDDTPRMNRVGENIQIVDVSDKTINQKDCRSILRRGASEGYAEVDFLSLSGETYRSTWLVRRARNRPDGALQNSEIRLMNLTAHREVAGRKTELLATIVTLIGLTFDQFTRAVLLAQGDFATFLKARQSEKAELLEKLTGTELYSRISVSIYEKTKKAEQDLWALQEQIKGIELLSEEQQEALAQEREGVRQEIEPLRAVVTLLGEKLKWLQEEEVLMQGIRAAEEGWQHAQATLGASKPRAEFLARVESVQEIREPFNEWKSTGKQREEKRALLVVQEQKREEHTRLLEQLEQQFNESEAQRKQHEESYTRYVPLIKQARALDIELSHAATREEEAGKEWKEAKSLKEKLDKRVFVLTEQQHSHQQQAEQLTGWFDRHAPYKEVVARVELIVSLAEDALNARKQSLAATRTKEDAEKLLEGYRQQLQELMAEAERLDKLLPAEIVLLREQLTEETPCPVCGSLHHPWQGVTEGQRLQEAELTQAKKSVKERVEQLTLRVESGKTETTRLHAVIQSYTGQANEALAKLEEYLLPLPAWKADFEQGGLQRKLREVADQWNKGTVALTSLREQEGELKITLQHEQKSGAEATESLALKAEKHRVALALLQELRAERAKLLKGKTADEVEVFFTENREKLTTRAEALNKERHTRIAQRESVNGIIQQISAEIEVLATRCVALEEFVGQWIQARSDVDSPEQLAELLSKESAWQAKEREVLNALKTALVTAQATLEERRNTLSRHRESVSRPQAEESREWILSEQTEKSQWIEQRSKREMEIEMAFANHQKGKERIKAFEHELRERALLAENWGKLNALLGSATGNKFKEIAQGYTLDALLGYANKHLSELSGRYRLQRIPDSLALQVVDLDMLGETRSVHLLSGGESFLVSLSLALGLSSLSSNRMKIESLFIDEGFGSLDIDTLRVAMDALEQLQTQGRKIGVISHVQEMTEHISTQIRVVKVNNGKSRVEVVAKNR